MASKRGRKANKRRKQGGSKPAEGRIDAGLKLSQFPFADGKQEAFRIAMKDRGKDAVQRLPQALEKVRDHFRAYDLVITLATVGYYGSLQGVGPNGPDGRNMLPGVDQHHLELLQAIALSVPVNELGRQFLVTEKIDGLVGAVVEASDSFAYSRMEELGDEADRKTHLLRSLQERLRLHTQVVRNWGYAHQVRTISAEMYGVVDTELLREIGFCASEVVKVASAIVRIYERRCSARFAALAEVIKGRTRDEVIRAYFREFPSMEGTAEEFLAKSPPVPLQNMKALLLAHSDLSLPEMATFEASEVGEDAGVDCLRVDAILRRVSLAPGELSTEDAMTFFMNNPVWSKPGICYGGKFLFPTPQIALSHIHKVVRSLIDSTAAKRLYEERRANYLEGKVGELLRRAFPSARLMPSQKWQVDGAVYETDWIVVLDRTVLIVEAKSAALTAQALRGAPERVRRHISDLVVAAAQQSSRLEHLILRAKQGDADSRSVVDSLSIDPDTVDTVVRLSITLDDFSMISAAEQDLKDIGWVPEGLDLPATLHLADFESVVDILEKPAFVLHYFAERPRLQRMVDLFADELDLLGVYLKSLFNIPELSGSTGFFATGESKAIDTYYERLEAGFDARKPAVAVSAQILSVLNALAERRPNGWTTISLDLLRTGNAHQQKRMWAEFEKLRRQVQKNHRDPGHRCAMIVNTPAADALVAFFVYPKQLAGERRERAEQIAAEALAAQPERKRITIIGRQVERWDEPYSFAAIAFNPEGKKGAA